MAASTRVLVTLQGMMDPPWVKKNDPVPAKACSFTALPIPEDDISGAGTNANTAFKDGEPPIANFNMVVRDAKLISELKVGSRYYLDLSPAPDYVPAPEDPEHTS